MRAAHSDMEGAGRKSKGNRADKVADVHTECCMPALVRREERDGKEEEEEGDGVDEVLSLTARLSCAMRSSSTGAPTAIFIAYASSMRDASWSMDTQPPS